MKIAIVAFYMMEPTIPLAKHISLEGVDVDLYSILPRGNQNTFVFDFTNNKQPIGFVNPAIVRTVMGEKLYRYVSRLNTKVFIYPDRRFQKLILKDLYYAFKFSRYLRKKKYDVIHINHISGRFWLFLYLFIKKKKVIQTLHEVTSHQSKTSSLQIENLKSLIKNSTPIIFHSDAAKQRFIEFRRTVTAKEIKKDTLVMIRFSLYETFHCFTNQHSKRAKNGKINILNFGRIVPYKGIHILIDAIKLLQDQYPIHLVIAGSGTPYFDFKDVKSYEFINKSLSNEKIVSLIESCDMIVLPYTSVSQSGIPMTVFSFNKPIIASNIAGFKEVIDNMQTGILVDNLNPDAFASSIEILAKNKELREIMSSNIEKKYKEGEYSWKSIAEKTISFYKEQLHQTELRN